MNTITDMQDRIDDHPLVRSAIDFGPRLRASNAAIERGRRLPVELAADMARAGFFSMLVPQALGGGEVSPMVMIRVLDELARGDSAASWCTMVGATAGLATAFLPPSGARRVTAYDHTPNVAAAVFAPMGRATPEGDGYRVRGRWPFASGFEHATWFMGNALIMDDSGPRMTASGLPELLGVWMPSTALTRHDTWSVSGLQGTGSHDVEVTDVFVPSDMTVRIIDRKPDHDGTLYRFPLFGAFAMGVAAVGLGIARAALDEFARLAQRKKSGRSSLVQQGHIQIAYAEAEAEWRAADALMSSETERVWRLCQSSEPRDDDRASLRLAANHAVKACVRAVDMTYHAGGGAAIYQRSPLQRHFRDIHTVTQHLMVSSTADKLIGRVLLGVQTETSQL